MTASLKRCNVPIRCYAYRWGQREIRPDVVTRVLQNGAIIQVRTAPISHLGDQLVTHRKVVRHLSSNLSFFIGCLLPL